VGGAVRSSVRHKGSYPGRHPICGGALGGLSRGLIKCTWLLSACSADVGAEQDGVWSKQHEAFWCRT
jgi:hypothetical protein